jgi:hypothetical protein
LEVLTKTEYFNTGFVFLRHKIQIDIKQKRHKSKGGEITNIEKIYIFYFFLNGPDAAQMLGLG